MYKENSLDISTMGDILCCPFKGFVKFVKCKTSESKSNALLAGTLCHECYNLVRLLSVIIDNANDIGIVERALKEIKFNVDIDKLKTYNDIYPVVNEYIKQYDYIDDPKDKKRTKLNISNSIKAYIDEFKDRMRIYKVYVDDDIIGTEVKFDVSMDEYVKDYRLIGKIDAIYVSRNGNELFAVENKTTSMLNENTLINHENSYQMIGYSFAIERMLNRKCNGSILEIHSVPINAIGVVCTSIQINELKVIDFINAFKLCIESVKNPILNRFGCTRFMKLCEFFTICNNTESVEERNEMISKLEDNTWSPLSDE